jgi:hypothetical protein
MQLGEPNVIRLAPKGSQDYTLQPLGKMQTVLEQAAWGVVPKVVRFLFYTSIERMV